MKVDDSGREWLAGFPGRDDFVNPFRIRFMGKGITARVVRKHRGDFRKNFQMLLGDILRNQKEEKQIDRFPVRRSESDGSRQSDKSGIGYFQSFYPAVRNGYAITESGRSHTVPCEEILCYKRAGNPAVVFENKACLFENTVLA